MEAPKHVVTVAYRRPFAKVIVSYLERADGEVVADWTRSGAAAIGSEEVERLIMAGGADVPGWDKVEL